MSQDALKTVLQSADATSSTSFGSEDTRRWSPEHLAALRACGVLGEAEYATSVICPGCDLHCLAEVEVLDSGEGELPRAYVVCEEQDDIGRVAVPLERLKRYSVDLGALAEVIAEAIGAGGGREELVPGRLWWLGRATFRAGTLDCFLACGAGREDAARALWGHARFQECSRAVVLTFWANLPEPIPGKVVVSLGRLLSLCDGGLRVDCSMLEDETARQVGRSPRRTRKFPTPPGTTWERVRIQILADGDEAVVTAGNVNENVKPAELGLAYARNSAKPTKQWELLVLMAKRGRLSSKDGHFDVRTVKQIERLTSCLQDFFGIEDDPFKPYREADGYEPRFELGQVRE